LGTPVSISILPHLRYPNSNVPTQNFSPSHNSSSQSATHSITMGTVSKVFNVIFRVGELCSALIVLGITGHFLWLLGEAGAYADSRIILAVVTASVSTAFSVITLLPFTFAFLAFPIDFVLFVVWLTTYCLLQSVSTFQSLSTTQLKV